jgi:phospholipid/cholesterol/gamma-HCH transport system permease protein
MAITEVTASKAVVRSGETRDGVFTIAVAGRLDSTSTGKIWRTAIETIQHTKVPIVALDASGVDYCDVSGIALLVRMRQEEERAGGKLEIHGLRPELQDLLDSWGTVDPGRLARPLTRRRSFVEEIGQAIVDSWKDVYTLISFVGEMAAALISAACHPRRVRWKDTLLIAEAVGIRALPIVALIGFLMGLIMAFQAAIPLGRFGAQVYVANLIGLSILREMGPLMTAIVVAGRSGSAFAAELGTMKVREEIDALITMGLDPVRFLVVTRVIAAVLMTPLLTIFADAVGLLGGAVVLRSLGYSWTTFYHQVQSAVGYGSLVGGLAKSFAFGILVAGIGSLRGLETGTGARAVGESTTSAVVSGIILIVNADGIFSVAYYYLGV